VRWTAAGVAVVLLTILLVAVLGGIPRDRTGTSGPILSVISGEVLVRSARDAPYRSGADGERLNAGMAVQTGAPNGRAVLTFRDGSTATLEPGATVSIDEVSTGTRGELIVRLGQTRGSTWEHVQPLVSPNSRFSVTTPSATAVVRGTSFEISVEVVGPSDRPITVTTVNVYQGQVDLVAAGVVQPVTASQTTEVVQSGAPQPPKQVGSPADCLRLELDSSAMMTVTDPHDRSAGQTVLGTVSQIPRSIVAGAQDARQLVDITSPKAGDWEIGIVPRGAGGSFRLVVTSVTGTTIGTSRSLVGAVQPGQRLVTHIRLGDGGQVELGPLEQVSRSRARIVEGDKTTTAPLPGARLFAPSVERARVCAVPTRD